MTIPMLTGWGDDIKNNLPQLAASIHQIINPNFQLQQNLKQAISLHPELAQQLANLESNNPGILQKTFGSSNVTNNIAGIKADTATQLDQKTAPSLIAAASDVNNQKEIVQNKLGLKSDNEKLREALGIKQMTGEIAAQGQESTLRGQQIDANQVKSDRNKRAQAIIASNPDLSPENFFNGKISTADQEALFNSDLAPVLATRMAEYQRNQDKLFQIAMRRQDRADVRAQAADNYIRNATYGAAIDAARSTGFAASPQAFLGLQDPTNRAAVQKVIDSGTDTSTLPPQIQESVRALSALNGLQDYNNQKKSDILEASKAKIMSGLQSDITKATAIAKNPKVDPSLVNASLAKTNAALSLNGSPYKIGYVSDPGASILGLHVPLTGGTNQLKVLDKQGKIVDGMDPSDAIQTLFTSHAPVVGNNTNKAPQSNVDIAPIVSKYQTLSAAGKSQFKIFAKQNYPPDVYQSIISAIGN